MALIIEDIHKVKLEFKNLSNLADVAVFQSMEEFDSEEEADKFVKKVLGICAPTHDAKIYDVKLFYEERRTDPGIPPQIKE